MQVGLGTEDVEAIAVRVADLIAERLQHRESAPGGWLDVRAAAQYAGCTPNAVRKAVSSGALRCTQDVAGGKCWFRSEWIDRWRGI